MATSALRSFSIFCTLAGSAVIGYAAWILYKAYGRKV